MVDSGLWEESFFLSFIISFHFPEPSTMMLLATGVLSLLAYAWRKRR